MPPEVAGWTLDPVAGWEGSEDFERKRKAGLWEVTQERGKGGQGGASNMFKSIWVYIYIYMYDPVFLGPPPTPPMVMLSQEGGTV